MMNVGSAMPAFVREGIFVVSLIFVRRITGKNNKLNKGVGGSYHKGIAATAENELEITNWV